MDNQEYEQKKQECWEDFCRYIVDAEEEFYNMFDRAYFLGKQKETVTQEEIEKAAKDYAYNVGDSDRERLIIRDAFVDGANFTLGKHEKDAEVDRTLKVNCQLFCRLCADADDYINEHLEENDSDYVYYQGRSDALYELYRGECKDAEDTVIQGWVAIDEAYNECYLHTNKPTPEVGPIGDTGDYKSYWRSKGQTYLLDADLFPDMDSDSDPQKVEITIKRKKK